MIAAVSCSSVDSEVGMEKHSSIPQMERKFAAKYDLFDYEAIYNDLIEMESKRPQGLQRRVQADLSRQHGPTYTTGATTLNILAEGDACSAAGVPVDNAICQIGLQCSSWNQYSYSYDSTAGKCVGPAKTGASCLQSASGFMCENGNWCKCDSGSTSCSCVKEIKDGETCHSTYECQGGSSCNYGTDLTYTSGKCTKIFSGKAGTTASSPVFCSMKTLPQANVAGYIDCVNPTDAVCTVATDCTGIWNSYFGVSIFDPFYFSCTSGKCVNKKSGCVGKLPSSLFGNNQFNNYWDGTNHVQGPSTTDICSYSACIYKDDFAKGEKPSCNELSAEVNNAFGTSDTAYIEIGGTGCSTTAFTRCKPGSYCAADTCIAAAKKAGDKCTLNWYSSANGQYSLCDFGGELYCNKYISGTSTTTIGSIGTCEKYVSKKAADCNNAIVGTVPDGSGATVISYSFTSCDYTAGMHCMYTSSTATSGQCTAVSSVKAGEFAQNARYCESGLAYTADITYGGKCDDWDKTTRACTDPSACIWNSNDYYYDYDYVRNGDYNGNGGTNRFSWYYSYYLPSNYECQSSKCVVAKGAAVCQAQTKKASSYTKTPDYAFQQNGPCPLHKCLYSKKAAKGFNLCTESSSNVVSPSLFLVLVFMLIFAMY